LTSGKERKDEESDDEERNDYDRKSDGRKKNASLLPLHPFSPAALVLRSNLLAHLSLSLSLFSSSPT